MKLRALLTLAMVTLAMAATDCGGAQRLTELVVVVDGDLTSPEEADRVTVVADDGNGHVVSLPAPGYEAPRSGYRLPLWGSVAARGELRPVTFTATAYLGADVVLRQTAVAEFVADESREVRLTLCKACRVTTCGEGERCSERGCAAKVMSDLPRWAGGEPARSTCSINAGAGDAGLDASDPSCDAGPDAGAPPPVMPVSAFNAGHPDYPHTCNIDEVLAEDDVAAGLDYSMGANGIANSITVVGGAAVTGCVGVDFGAAIALDHVEVRARAIRDSSRTACPPPACQGVVQPNACARCCSPCVEAQDPDSGVVTNYCTKGGELQVFIGTDLGVYQRAGTSVFASTLFRAYQFDSKGQLVRYAVVCRSADGPATADLEVDVVKGRRACP